MDLRYPIGQFEWEGPSTPEQRELWIEEIKSLPEKLRVAVQAKPGTAGFIISRWRLEHPTGRSPSGRQSYEQLYPVQTCFDGRQPND